jgi:hypothetical protein
VKELGIKSELRWSDDRVAVKDEGRGECIGPMTQRDHSRPIFSIIAPVASEKVRPPIPEPAALIPFARLRRRVNHRDSAAMLGTYMKPTPRPTSAP